MAEQILLDAEKITLEQIERYLWERRERSEQGKKNSQDFLFELIADLMNSNDNESFSLDGAGVALGHQPDDMQKALRLITDRLDQIDRKISPPKEKAPRTEQFAKERCQTVARYLWQMHPEMTIVEVAEHEAVFNLGITKSMHYRHETVRKWVADVDPRPAEKKIGRPRKAMK